MRHLISFVRRFVAGESGSTAIEYALIGAGISIVIVGVVNSLGSNLKTVFYDKLAAMF